MVLNEGGGRCDECYEGFNRGFECLSIVSFNFQEYYHLSEYCVLTIWGQSFHKKGLLINQYRRFYMLKSCYCSGI